MHSLTHPSPLDPPLDPDLPVLTHPSPLDPPLDPDLPVLTHACLLLLVYSVALLADALVGGGAALCDGARVRRAGGAPVLRTGARLVRVHRTR